MLQVQHTPTLHFYTTQYIIIRISIQQTSEFIIIKNRPTFILGLAQSFNTPARNNLSTLNLLAPSMFLSQSLLNSHSLQPNPLQFQFLSQMRAQNQNKNIQQLLSTAKNDPPNQNLQRQQRCFNKFCTHKTDKFTKVKSIGRANKDKDYIYFCDRCYKLYQKKQFCDFCEQISSNKRSEQDDQEWIRCDLCSKWNHLNCESQYGNQNIQKEKEQSYYCLDCREITKQTAKRQQKKEAPSPPEQSDSNPFVYEYTVAKPRSSRPLLREEIEEYKPSEHRREKCTNLTITKDNKTIHTFRVNLLEEEIRKDLEQLRALQVNDNLMSKKKVKKNTIELSPVKQQKPSPSSHDGKEPTQAKKVIPTQDNFLTPPKQAIEVVAPPVLAAPINRPRRNTKVNYRSMVGEP